MGFGGTALKLKSSLVLETELHQQITTSIFVGYKCPLHTILKVFSLGDSALHMSFCLARAF